MKCVICRGARTIRLPVYKRTAFAAAEPTTVELDEGSRLYPCPECAETVAQDRIGVLQTHSEVSAHIHDPDFRAHYTQHAAHMLVDQMLRGNFIRFERGPTDKYEMSFPIRATVGLVAQAPIATLEQRVAQHEAALAQEIEAEAIKQIRIWNSHYTGDEGAIYKGQAVSAVREAVEAVLKRRTSWVPA